MYNRYGESFICSVVQQDIAELKQEISIMNNEGYRDPTADEAMDNISADDNKVNLVILICKAAAKLGDSRLLTVSC